MVMVQLVVVVPAAVPRESTTWAVKVNGPDAVGVPVMAPVELFRVKPVGREPLMMEKVYGGTPPEAVSAEL